MSLNRYDGKMNSIYFIFILQVSINFMGSFVETTASLGFNYREYWIFPERTAPLNPSKCLFNITNLGLKSLTFQSCLIWQHPWLPWQQRVRFHTTENACWAATTNTEEQQVHVFTVHIDLTKKWVSDPPCCAAADFMLHMVKQFTTAGSSAALHPAAAPPPVITHLKLNGGPRR